MSLWPRSLLGRSALLVAGIVILGQVISALWLYFTYLDTRLERTATMIATEVETIGHALETMTSAQRERYIKTLKTGLEIQVIPVSKTPGVLAPDHLAVQRFEHVLRARFAQPVTIRWQKTHLWLAWPPARAQQWIGLPYTPRDRDLWSLAGLWLLLGGMLGLLGALWIARRINRPLAALAGAASRLGRGETPHELPETGPTEIATLSRVFNQMTGEVQRLTADRTLLLAGVSHDLRTPLARLRLALEMLGDKTDATLQQGMIQDIDDMDRIVEQFLAYIRDGDIEPVRQTDLNELVRSTATRYQRQGHHVGLDLVSLPPLALRATAMQRLLSNLIDNALRHGGGDVDVRTRLNNEKIFLSVLDRGPGLSATTTNDSAISYRSRLGLGVVERIAQLHRSRLQLLPREGGGLEARVELRVEPPSISVSPSN